MWESIIPSITAIVIAIVTSYLIMKQITMQSNVNSLKFTLEYIEKIINKPQNQDIIKKLYDKHDNEFNDTITFSSKEIEYFLNDLENIMLIKKKNVIKKEDIVYQISTNVLSWIKDDTQFKNTIRDLRAKNKNLDLYEELEKFLKEF